MSTPVASDGNQTTSVSEEPIFSEDRFCPGSYGQSSFSSDAQSMSVTQQFSYPLRSTKEFRPAHFSNSSLFHFEFRTSSSTSVNLQNTGEDTEVITSCNSDQHISMIVHPVNTFSFSNQNNKETPLHSVLDGNNNLRHGNNVVDQLPRSLSSVLLPINRNTIPSLSLASTPPTLLSLRHKQQFHLAHDQAKPATKYGSSTKAHAFFPLHMDSASLIGDILTGEVNKTKSLVPTISSQHNRQTEALWSVQARRKASAAFRDPQWLLERHGASASRTQPILRDLQRIDTTTSVPVPEATARQVCELIAGVEEVAPGVYTGSSRMHVNREDIVQLFARDVASSVQQLQPTAHQLLGDQDNVLHLEHQLCEEPHVQTQFFSKENSSIDTNKSMKDEYASTANQEDQYSWYDTEDHLAEPWNITSEEKRMVVDAIEGLQDYLLQIRTMLKSRYNFEETTQSQQLEPYKALVSNKKEVLGNQLAATKKDIQIQKLNLDEACEHYAAIKRSLSKIKTFTVSPQEQKRLEESQLTSKKDRVVITHRMEELTLQKIATQNQLSIVTRLEHELLETPKKRSFSIMEHCLRSDAAVTVFGETNRDKMLCKVVLLYMMRIESNRTAIRIAIIADTVALLKQRLQDLVSAFW